MTTEKTPIAERLDKKVAFKRDQKLIEVIKETDLSTLKTSGKKIKFLLNAVDEKMENE